MNGEKKEGKIWDVLFHESRLRHWHENFHIKGHVPGLRMSQAGKVGGGGCEEEPHGLTR